MEHGQQVVGLSLRSSQGAQEVDRMQRHGAGEPEPGAGAGQNGRARGIFSAFA